MSFMQEIEWLKVIDALNKSKLSGRDFYKREFAKFCPGADEVLKQKNDALKQKCEVLKQKESYSFSRDKSLS